MDAIKGQGVQVSSFANGWRERKRENSIYPNWSAAHDASLQALSTSGQQGTLIGVYYPYSTACCTRLAAKQV